MRQSTRIPFLFLTLAPLGLLGGGVFLGAVMHIQPCYLCNFQRFLYMSLIVFGLGGLLINGWPRFWAALYGATALGGVAAAAYQSWMQYAPQSVVECGIGERTLIEQFVDWLGMQWPQMFMVTGFCTSRDWVFLGLSLANWSVLCFLGLAAIAGWLLFRRDE